ncbi:hypothetical protein EB796_008475 [Bugula neritina]|uniref:Uncharacterized protein n=1 Tax=Bugula neritina TaxID=10212 RepID=A0A7J7K5J7_BUGNE|nr:hypothetical protein EB796_008475 [Bugula neritina]
MSMAPDSLHLPSGFEEIQATIHPTSTELEGIEDLLNRDLDAEVSELSRFISPELHSRTYEQDIQLSNPQTGVRTQNMQSVDIGNDAATHGAQSTETSLEEVLGASSVSDPIEQQLNSQTQELNENFQFPSCQVNLPTIDQSYPLPYLQDTVYQLMTKIPISKFTKQKQNMFNLLTVKSTSAVNQSYSTLPEISTQPTHSQIPFSTLSSNENLQSVARNNASSRNFSHLFSPDMFMVPFQLIYQTCTNTMFYQVNGQSIYQL